MLTGEPAAATAMALCEALWGGGLTALTEVAAAVAEEPEPLLQALADPAEELRLAAEELGEHDLLLVRALVAQRAAPAGRRIDLGSVTEVSTTEILREFAAHEEGDRSAAARAELLGWTVVHALSGDLSQMELAGSEVVLAACVLGGEQAGRLGKPWRTAVGAMAMQAAERGLENEGHAPFFPGVLASFGNVSGREAAGDGDPLDAKTAYLTLRIALAMHREASQAELAAIENEASKLALSWFEYGGPADALEEAVALARSGAARTDGPQRF
jgi:hypothetical protein